MRRSIVQNRGEILTGIVFFIVMAVCIWGVWPPRHERVQHFPAVHEDYKILTVHHDFKTGHFTVVRVWTKMSDGSWRLNIP